MMPESMEPYSKALVDFYEGDTSAEMFIQRDDGHIESLLAKFFFRGLPDFSSIENKALDLCRGHVLDVGAGVGPHSLVLQEQGIPVSAIEFMPELCRIMVKRGIRDVRCADIRTFEEEPFDTLLILNHGIGLIGTLSGLDGFLPDIHKLVNDDGQILLDSLDVTKTTKKKHLDYHERIRQAGRFVGEFRLQFEYKGFKGPQWEWLHIDPDTLGEHAQKNNWACQTILQEESGNYLAQLTPLDRR